MRLAVPLGLIGLITIAVLILIYIFKPKYQDKKFSSTYIWKLSLKYVKRKVPFQWVQNSLLFLIQLLILAIIAFSMALPQVVLDNKDGEKIIILDASASMSAVVDGSSRFDRAKDEIIEMVDETTKTHKVSIILAGEKPSVLISRSDSASYAKQKLFEAECGMMDSDVAQAMSQAEVFLAENPSAKVYFFTDNDYADCGKVQVVNVAKSEWNAAILDFSAKREKGRYVFTAEVASYGRAAEIPVGLTIDGKSQLPKLAQCNKNETVKLVWDDLEMSTYNKAELHLTASDSTAFDNDFCFYAPNTELFSVQLVSDNPGFINSALRSNEKCRVVIPNDTVEEKSSGFDLYIYDNVMPKTMPSDGAVWFINPSSEIPTAAGIKVGATIKSTSTKFWPAQSSSSQIAGEMLKSITPSGIRVSQYTEITSNAGYDVILEINDDPILLVKEGVNGVKTVVLAFDLHMADFPVLIDFPLFINNVCTSTMSKTVEKSLYEVGDEIKINAKADTYSLSVKAKYDDGEEKEYTYTEYPVLFRADKPGAFEVTQQTISGRTANASFYVRVSKKESVFEQKLNVLENPIIPYGSGTDTSIPNNTEDITFYFIIALLVLLCVEWGLQYREQY